MDSLTKLSPSRLTLRIRAIKANVPLLEILHKYGYSVNPQYDQDQQFSCNLHGDGSDSKASARYYSESNSTYCFGCGKIRSSVDYVSSLEGVSLSKACSMLEKAFGLDPIPFETEETNTKEEEKKINVKKTQEDFTEIKTKLLPLLQRIKEERAISEEKFLRLLYLFFRHIETENTEKLGRLYARSNHFLRANKNNMGQS